jgi:hypothetical protein
MGRLFLSFFLLSATLLFAGCSQESELINTEVEGTAKLDGQPVVGATVEFYPVIHGGYERLPYSTGSTDSKGFYRLTCENAKAGAIVGKHRVVVRYPPPPRGAPRNASPGPPIPLDYTVAADTKLQIDVKSDQKVYDLVLKSK